MDMTPPQAPPAVTTSQNQAAIDTVKRLADVQAWLIEQQSAMPLVADMPAVDGKAAFLDRLTDFWRTPVGVSPGAASVPRASALATQLATAMRDDATLLGMDGTLDDRAVALATAFTRGGSEGVPPHIRASELMIGDVPYAGAIVVQQRNTDDLALLFSPARGWQAFDSLASLHETTERRLREALVQTDELSGIVSDDIGDILDEPFVTSRDAGPDAFDVLIDRIAQVQGQRVANAWEEFAVGLTSSTQLADRLRDALDLHDHLDVNALLEQRDSQLLDAIAEARLVDVPASVSTDWKRARADYREQLVTATHRRDNAQLDLMPMDVFVARVLKEKLLALGVTDDPADLVIGVVAIPTNPLAVLSAVFTAPDSRRTSLVELAYQNIGALDTVSITAERLDGRSLSGTLNGSDIRSMVREIDLPTRYNRYLEETLQTTPTGETVRSIALDLQLARMRFELEESRLSYFLADEPRSFPHADRDTGYQWAKAVIDSPDPGMRRRVGTHDIVARQLMYRGLPFTDLFEIGVRTEGSSSRVVYYTPDAPDGIVFRQFDSRETAARTFLYNPAFERYLLDHLPAEFGVTAANGTRHFKISDGARLSQWVLSQNGQDNFTRMEERITQRDVGGNLVQAMYDASLSTMQANVTFSARSADAADWRAATAAVAMATSSSNLSATIVGQLGAVSLEQTANLFPSLWRTYDNIKAGDHSQAFLDFVEAYHSSLNVIAPHPARFVRFPGAAVRATRHSRLLVPTKQRIPDPDTLFESRFAASSFRPQDADAVKDGVYRVGGSHYIQQNGQAYGVRFDATTLNDEGTGTWRLARAGTLDANFSGPAIERTASGMWRHSRQIGLRGGGDQSRKAHVKHIVGTRGRFDSRLVRMSSHQRSAMWAELLSLTPNEETADLIYRSMRHFDPARRGIQPPITDLQRGYWFRAMDRGLATPRRNPIDVTRAVIQRPMAPRPPAPAAQGSSTAAATVSTPRRVPMLMIASDELRQLEPAEWPQAVWAYVSPEQVTSRLGATDIRLPQAMLAGDRFQGIAGLTLGPSTPTRTVPGVPTQLVTDSSTLGSITGGWVRIDMEALRRRATAGELPLPHVFMPREPGSTGVIIVPAPTARDPRGARDLWLTAGEFRLGQWPRQSTSRP